jgi:preprotein translocase subunit SecD
VRRHGWSALISVVVAAGACLGAVGLGYTPKLGLDLQGGLQVVLHPCEKATSDALDQAVEIIRNRIDGIGVAEPSVARQGSNILVELPGVKDRDTARAIVGRTAELQFRLVDQVIPLSSLTATSDTTATTATGDTTATTATGDTSATTAAPTTAAATTASGGALGVGAPVLAQAESTTTAAPTTAATSATTATGDTSATTVPGDTSATTVPGDTSATTATTVPAATTTTAPAPPSCDVQSADATTTTISGTTAGPTPASTETTVAGDTTATSTPTATTTPTASTTVTTAAAATTTASGGALGGAGDPSNGSPVLAQAASTTTTPPTTSGTTATTATGDTTATTATGDTTATTATGDTTATTATGDTTETTAGGIPPEILEGTGCLDATQACYTVDKDKQFLLQLQPSSVNGRSVRDPNASFQNEWVVTLDFDSEGTQQWAALTTANVGKQVAVVLDGIVQSFPTINNAITSGQTEISGSFSEKDAKDLALVLRYGSLPVRLEELTAQEVSATLGKDQLRAGIWAGIIGLAIVTIYMVAMYRVLGLLVLAGLGVTGLAVWAVIAYLGEKEGLTLTLAGVTGLIVSLGVAVDSFIIYFERLKDELKAGASVRSSVERGFRKAWKTILAADLVSLIGALLLYLLAVGAVRGFAFYLGLATLLDLLVAYFFMYPMTAILARNRRLTRSKTFGLGAGLRVEERQRRRAEGPADAVEAPS